MAEYDSKTDSGDQDIAQVPLYRRKRVAIPALAAVLVLALAAGYWLIRLRDYVATDDAYIDADRASISAKMLGRVAALDVDEGDTVRQGQLLVRLDDTDLRAQLAQARAGLALAENSVTLASVGLQRTQEDFTRIAELFKEGHSTQEQYDHTQKAAEAARADQAIARSKVAAAAAQVNVVAAQLGYTTVTAPFDGIVAKRWVLPGEVVQPAQPMLTIYDLRRVWVTANLEENKIHRVRIGDRVEVSVDAVPGRRFTGTVAQIGRYAASQFALIPVDNTSGNFTKVTQRIPLKVVLDAGSIGGVPLSPGTSAEIRIKVR